VSDLTAKEQANVRLAVAFLRAKCGGADLLAKALRCSRPTLWRPPTPTVVFRVARMAGVGIDDVLTGKFPPPGTCPHCGHVKDDGGI
jgi:hypothetical protein